MGYLSERERIRRHIRDDLTSRERIRNWWCYHRGMVLVILIGLLLVGYFVRQRLGQVEPDYHVAYVGAAVLSEEETASIEERLASYGVDVNGDGRVVVRLHEYRIPLGEDTEIPSDVLRAAYTGLESDFYTDQSGIFLLRAPAAFQEQYGALSYLDGTLPPEGASDWENMVIPWPDDDQLFAGFRGLWDMEEEASLATDDQLWRTMLEALGVR